MFRKGVLIELSDLPNAQGKNSEFSLNCDNFMDFCCIVTFIIFLNSYYRPVCFFPDNYIAAYVHSIVYRDTYAANMLSYMDFGSRNFRLELSVRQKFV